MSTRDRVVEMTEEKILKKDWDPLIKIRRRKFKREKKMETLELIIKINY